MFRRSNCFFQFRMGKYRGPLVAPGVNASDKSASHSSSSAVPSSSSLAYPSPSKNQKHPLQEEVRRALEQVNQNKSAATGAAAAAVSVGDSHRPVDRRQSAVQLAESIAQRVARQDEREEQQLANLHAARRLRQRNGGRLQPAAQREQFHEDEDARSEVFSAETEGAEVAEESAADGGDARDFVPGARSGRAPFEIPTLAAAAPPEAWVFRPQLLDANRMPTSMVVAPRDDHFVSASKRDVDNNNNEKSGNNCNSSGVGNNDAHDDDNDGEQGTNDSSNLRKIERMLSPALVAALRRCFVEWNIQRFTPVQEMVLSAALADSRRGIGASGGALEPRRDVCCIAPTGTGKTLCYAIPAIQVALECNGAADDATAMLTKARLDARDAARASLEAQQAERQSLTCRYCGLNVKQQRVCPQTGAPHPPVPSLVAYSSGDPEEDGGSLHPDGETAAAEAAATDGEDADAMPQRTKKKESFARPSSKVAASPSSLILVPTNALVDQVHRVMRGLHCGLRVAGVRNMHDEDSQMRMVHQLAGCDVLVSTPTMALTLLRKHRLTLKSVRFVAIDEIDHSLELPQYDLVNLVLALLPTTETGALRRRNFLAPSAQRRSYYQNSSISGVEQQEQQQQVRRMLVGATLPKPLIPFAAKLMHPTKARWVVGSLLENEARNHGSSLRSVIPLMSVPEGKSKSTNNNNSNAAALSSPSSSDPLATSPSAVMDTFGGVTIASNISHSVLMISRLEKTDKLRWLYDTGRILPTQPTIIFCNHKESVRFLADALKTSTLSHHAVRAAAVYSGQTEEARAAALGAFHSGTAQILVATDGYARGIDFPNVFAVVQFDFPPTFDVFIHRAGRCGRRGNAGRNFVMFEAADARHAPRLADYLRQRRQDVPPQLAKYARQSWADLYREQVQGLTLRRRDPRTNATMHNPPMGLTENRYPKSLDTFKRNRYKDSSD